MTTRLRALLGDYPGTAALKNGTVKSDSVALDFADRLIDTVKELIRAHGSN